LLTESTAIILAKSGLFETVVRSRIAGLRNHHASHIINTGLFGGSTEAHGNIFTEPDSQQYAVVGKIEKPGLAAFIDPWQSRNCVFLPAKKLK
jgi:hypothetical protein